MKEKNVPEDKKGQLGYGDVYTFTALCADSKLIPSWYVGRRSLESTNAFIYDLSCRMKNKIQLTTDGFYFYLEAVNSAFGENIDYSMLIKMYGNTKEGEKRYSPAACTGMIKQHVHCIIPRS